MEALIGTNSPAEIRDDKGPMVPKNSGGSSPQAQSRKARVLSVPANLGRDELSLNKLRFSSLDLYGRDLEVQQLREAYDRICRTRKGPLGLARVRRNGMVRSSTATVTSMPDSSSPPSPFPEVVMIAGRSGTGKSALAMQLRKPVQRTGGLFASGKFDSQRRSEPYTALKTAFSGLCDDILSLRESTGDPTSSSLLRMRCAVQDAVGSESVVLAEIIPNLHQIIGDKCTPSSRKSLSLGFEGSKNRFIFLMRTFLRAVCAQRPLVLFLDDLQWADMASLELLRNLVTDRENPSLLLVGSYRDNEVEHGSHPFAKWLREIGGQDIGSSNAISVSSIRLENLDVEAVNELIADILSSVLSSTEGLAEIVHKKTHGNIFAVIHYLKNLHEEGILQYCLGTLRWKWDEDEVQSRTSVTDNVANLMTSKIRNNLTSDVREVLQMSACLGSSFDLSTLSIIAEKLKGVDHNTQRTSQGTERSDCSLLPVADRCRVVQCLDVCIDEGLLEKDGTHHRYRFAHDQILAAAFSLIPEDRRELLQFQVGEALVESLTEPDLEKHLFVVVGLLNHGVGLIPRGDERCIRLSELNLRAGKKAMKSSAFEPATTYFKTGIHLLGSNPWKDNHNLILDLYSTAAEAECCDGQQEEMKSYLDEVLGQDIPLKEKIRAYCTQIHSMCFVQDKALDAMDVALHVLDQLGVNFPSNSLKRATVIGFVKTKVLLKKMSISDLSSLPVMEDETRLLAMQLMNKLCDLAYFAKRPVFPWVVLKMVRWSARHGVCKFSPGAFAAYGLLLCAGAGDFTKGNEFGKVAVALLKRLDAKEVESRVLFICNQFISHWMVHAHLTRKRFFHGYEVGMQTGDIGFAMLSIRAYCQMSLFIGKPLSLLDAEIRSYRQQMTDYKQEKAIALVLPAWQFVLNLMGRSDDPVVLTGEVMRQEDMLRQCTENKDDILRNVIRSHQIWAAFYFGNLEIGRALLEEAKGKPNRAPFLTWRSALFEGLTAFELARKTGLRRWKTHAAKVASKVHDWAERGNVNCKHVQLLFQAEKAALDGEKEQARKKYEIAISTVSRHGFLHDRALANERAGEFSLETGDKYFAAHHLGLAHQLYSSWGARAKAEHLHKKHSYLFDEESSVPLGEDIERRWSE